ncbi:MAG: hypothetical protein FWE87_06440 [Coriobacteriia bacterium]|nr:hypothetical protein [Coriobacteriia bacterium]
MKVLVRSPLMTDRIQETLESYSDDGVKFELISRRGMAMEFEVNDTDPAALAKRIIRATDFGQGLNFSAINQK